MEIRKVLIILGAFFVAGGGVFWLVARPKSNQEKGTGGGTVGLANPAAVYCEERGGVLRNEETEQGTRGICVLPDGTECGQWDYFYGRCSGGGGGDYSNFRTDDGVLSFDYPTNWPRAEIQNLETVLPDLVDKYQLTMPLLLSDPDGGQITLSIYHFEGGMGLDAVMDTLKEELVAMGQSYNEVSRQMMGEMMVVDSTVDIEDVVVKVRDLLFLVSSMDKDTVYNISFSARQENWSDYQTIFNHIQTTTQYSP